MFSASNSRRRRIATIALALVALLALAWTLTPAALTSLPPSLELPADVDGYLRTNEARAAKTYPLIPGTEKRVRWQSPGDRTKLAVVYLHGFSATRQEIAPAMELLADRLAANLFETRLTGHGRQRGAMLDTAAEDWLRDAAEALAVGARIGERIVLVGTSTGATLSLAMAEHASMQAVEHIVLLAPNFAPIDSAARWLTRPAGPMLAKLVAGETRSWVPHNEEQARYWSTSYPIAAAVEMMRLVDRANAPGARNFSQNLLMLISPDDRVVSAPAAMEAFDRITARRKQVVIVDEPGDPSNHVLAGRILSPQSTDQIVDAIVEFVKSDR